MAVNVDKKPMVGLVAKAINELFHNPKDMFWTGRVMDILFDGIPIDCSSDAFEAQAACSVFESGDVKAIKPINDTHYSFSLFASVSIMVDSYSSLLTIVDFLLFCRCLDSGKWH